MAVGTHPQNYTIGRGEIHFARFTDAAYTPGGFRYIGNTPEFNLTIESEDLEHYSSDEGIRELDDSIALEVNRTGSMITDNIAPENVALFFFGSEATIAEAGGDITEDIESVEQGLYYQLGISASRPAGARGIEGDTDDSNSAGAFAVYLADSNSEGNTPYVAGTDYILDPAEGQLYIVPGGNIADGTDIHVTYTIKGQTFTRVISGSSPVEGAMKYIEKNPKGTNSAWYFPRVQVSPNGDYQLKSDEWQQIPFSLQILKRTDREAIYRDGTPTFT